MSRKLATIPRIPTGTLIRKTQFQLACSVISPPTSGPIASASADTPAQMPIAVPRSRGGKVAAMIASVAGFISAAPTPWTIRHPIRRLAAVGHAAEEGRNGEDHDPDDEDPPPAHEVGELAAGQHQRGEAQRVAGDDPFELGETDAEVPLDRRDRDVHHRVVEHDHEEPERDRAERPPLAVLARVEALSHL